MAKPKKIMSMRLFLFSLILGLILPPLTAVTFGVGEPPYGRSQLDMAVYSLKNYPKSSLIGFFAGYHFPTENPKVEHELTPRVLTGLLFLAYNVIVIYIISLLLRSVGRLTRPKDPLGKRL